MDYEERLEVCKCIKYEYYEPGKTVFKQGDSGNKFYIILKGVCQVSIPNPTLHGIDSLERKKLSKKDRAESRNKRKLRKIEDEENMKKLNLSLKEVNELPDEVKNIHLGAFVMNSILKSNNIKR